MNIGTKTLKDAEAICTERHERLKQGYRVCSGCPLMGITCEPIGGGSGGGAGRAGPAVSRRDLRPGGSDQPSKKTNY